MNIYTYFYVFLSVWSVFLSYMSVVIFNHFLSICTACIFMYCPVVKKVYVIECHTL